MVTRTFKVTLREFEDKDIALFSQWLKKPYIKKWFINPDAWLKEIYNRKTEYAFIHHFILLLDDKPIGFCQYYDYALGSESWHGSYPIDHTYSVDYLIGEENYLRQGYAKKMLFLLEDKIKSEAIALNIIVKPHQKNTMSRDLLKSVGYLYDSENDLYYKNI